MDTSKLNRLEIIDHRPCKSCRGRMTCNMLQDNGEYKEVICPECQATGINGGRTVIVGGPAYGQPGNNKIELSFQDDDRTLKIFITEE